MNLDHLQSRQLLFILKVREEYCKGCNPSKTNQTYEYESIGLREFWRENIYILKCRLCHIPSEIATITPFSQDQPVLKNSSLPVKVKGHMELGQDSFLSVQVHYTLVSWGIVFHLQ